MKLYVGLISLSLIGCSVLVQQKDIDWESLAQLNGHSFYEDKAPLTEVLE